MNPVKMGQHVNAVSYMGPFQNARPESVQAAVTANGSGNNDGLVDTLMYGGLAIAGLALIWAISFGAASD